MFKLIIACAIAIAAALYLTACANKHVSQWKYKDGQIIEAYYSDDTSAKIWSEGSGKTIEISPSVVGGI